jgi:hypothetical protein
MSVLAFVILGGAALDAEHRVPVRHRSKVRVVDGVADTAGSLTDALAGMPEPFVCLADASVRLLEDGLARTLDSLAEPALAVAADGWIHRSMLVLCEGAPPDAREVRRMTLGPDSLAPTPAAVLGGAMDQPGALVVAREPLLALLADARHAPGAGGIVSAVTRSLGGRGRLMLMPWILSERLAVRSSEEMDLGDAIGIDAARQFAAAEMWRGAWHGSDELSMAQLRLIHALAPPPRRRSIARRVAGRVRRALR